LVAKVASYFLKLQKKISSQQVQILCKAKCNLLPGKGKKVTIKNIGMDYKKDGLPAPASFMIKEGTIIEGPFWNEPVEVKKVEEFASRIHIIGVTVFSHKHIDQLLPKEELEKLKTRKLELDFSARAEESFLCLEAIRYRYASLFDPLLAMNVSKIDPLPFQIEAVYGYVLKLPLIRFLIADDPGAGKTIMAGLIVKELKLRHLVERVLIVVPGHLKDQWQREMKEKFQESFRIIDRNIFDSHYGENPWAAYNQIITSMDFAKREDILPSLHSVHWDMVIVDEAHKMAAYVYGFSASRTDRYKLGEVLSRTTNHLLFLTATPHKGDPENFRLFLDLLEPGFFATDNLVQESLERKDNPLFIRRMKEELKDFEGRLIFTRRFPQTIKFRLSEKEKILYNELSRYVIGQYNMAIQKENRRNVAFALLILQRRMASSTYAVLKSLERRKKRLEELLKGPGAKKEPVAINIFEIDDEDEQSRWKQEEQWETLSVAENTRQLEEEISTIEKLIEAAKEILTSQEEIKLKELKSALQEGFRKIKEIGGNEKILIFTESKDTLDYLVQRIKSWGYSVNFIHGAMKLEDRVEAEKIFQQETQVMVATEAAGEGINLQFCHLMINYDIPWNPNRIEQRMGRIHRYGQQKDVYIFNLIAEDTREGEVLSRIFDKLEEIRKAVGSDKVFDIIGDVFYGKNLYQLILEAVAKAKTMEEIVKEIDIEVDEQYRKYISAALGESLATRHIDYTRIKEMEEKAKEYRLIPEYVEEFFKKAFVLAGGKFRTGKDGFIAVEQIPYEVRAIAEDINFKSKHGIMLKSYSRVTFDKEKSFKNPEAEFISFGHPLLEALLEWVCRNYTYFLQKGSVFEDPCCKYNGIIWFLEGEVKDGKGETAGKRLLAFYDDGKNLEEINPAILWDLIPSSHPEYHPEGKKFSQEKVREYAVYSLEKYREELLTERKRQAEVKRKYGIKSLEHLIGKIDADLISLYERQALGENVDIAIKNKEERKNKYEKELEILQKEIEQETSLTISMPKFTGAIAVKPLSFPDEVMVSDEEIEKIGMQVAMEYERSQGRTPEDVSRQNLGFDIRSKGEKEIRYIEVKARKEEGDIALTRNEMFKAKRFQQQYWLYVVGNAVKKPVLHIINNPAENLKPEVKTQIVRFIIPEEQWKTKACSV